MQRQRVLITQQSMAIENTRILGNLAVGGTRATFLHGESE